MGKTSEDMKWLKKNGILTLYTLGILDLLNFLALMKITMCFRHLEASHIMLSDLNYVKSSSSLWDRTLKKMPNKISRKFEFDCWVNATTFWSYFCILWLVLPKGLDEFIKRLQMWLNIPQCGHKEGQKLPFFWRTNHQGESFHVYIYIFFSPNIKESL